MTTIRIASVQLNSHHDIDDNLGRIEQAIKTAATNQARLVVLPENACLIGTQAMAGARFDELSMVLAELAKRYDVHLLAGTLPCPTRSDGTAVPNGKHRQTSLMFDNQGQLLARYDKIHLFRAVVNDAVGSYDEGRTFEAGLTPVVTHCMIDGQPLNVGMMVCFDLRFPRLAQMLSSMGADVLTAPSAFTHATGKAHWQMLLQARALDSQCLVVGAAQGGTHDIGKDRTRQTWGHSTIVSADGEVVATSGAVDVGDDGFLVCYADFDKSKQAAMRERLPIAHCHRLA